MLLKRVKNKGLIRDFTSRNGLAQAHRQLFQQVCQQLPEQNRRVCAMSSAGSGEGRSTLAINLARIAAKETSAPVLLIDADTEAPALYKVFDLSPGPGLSDVVADQATIDEALRPTGDSGVTILTHGNEPLGAVTLAESEKVATLLESLRSRFGWVFVDTAPLLNVPGAAAFARRADGVILAVRWSSTRAQLITQAGDKLDTAGANTLGVVLTQRCFVIPSYIYRRL